MIKKYNLEKDFQRELGRSLLTYNCEVYFDKNIDNNIPCFHGNKQRPDILLFIKDCIKENKEIDIKNPIAIEVKNISKTNKFSDISKSVSQIDRYFENEYYTENWEGKIQNILLATPHSIFKERVFDWVNGTNEFNQGIDWTIRRILWTISNKSGILKRDSNKNYYIEFHNSSFYLDRDGILKNKYKVID